MLRNIARRWGGRVLGGVSALIIEGPDGAGKSTLIRSLRIAYLTLKLAPRACTSLAGPLSGDALIPWLKKYGAMDGYIYDRHPCISGPVYDAVYADPRGAHMASDPRYVLRAPGKRYCYLLQTSTPRDHQSCQRECSDGWHRSQYSQNHRHVRRNHG